MQKKQQASARHQDDRAFFEGSRVAVTGAAGTVGRELVAQLLDMPVKEVRAIDNHENSLFDLECHFTRDARLHIFYGDIRNPAQMLSMLSGMDYVFHAAAMKHVPLSERSPCEAVQTNIYGIQNVIAAAQAGGVKKVISTSSDKAVNPTSVMGTSKLMGERLMTAANATRNGQGGTIFSSTRFGNVLGSQGSVVPLFARQIAAGGPVTVTDREMTRFVMSLPEAVGLVIHSTRLACGGEIFVTKMPVLAIGDLADVMVDMLAPLSGYRPQDIEIREIGARPGEKHYEELTSEEELKRTLELEDYFSVLPAFRNIYEGIEFTYPGYGAAPVSEEEPYISSTQPRMSRQEIREFLLRPTVLEDSLHHQLTAAQTRSKPENTLRTVKEKAYATA